MDSSKVTVNAVAIGLSKLGYMGTNVDFSIKWNDLCVDLFGKCTGANRRFIKSYVEENKDAIQKDKIKTDKEIKMVTADTTLCPGNFVLELEYHKILKTDTEFADGVSTAICNVFRKTNWTCVLDFKSKQATLSTQTPFIQLDAICSVSSCNCQYRFSCLEKPQPDYNVLLRVQRRGRVRHKRCVSMDKLNLREHAPLIAYDMRDAQYIDYKQHKELLTEVKREEPGSYENIKDLLKKRTFQINEGERYIQSLAVPLSVNLFVDDNFELLAEFLDSSKPVSLCLDGTDSLDSMKTQTGEKPVYYFSLVVPPTVNGSSPWAVCELLTTTSDRLLPWLNVFVGEIEAHTQSKVNRIETGFSWTLLEAAMEAFNNLTIEDYMELTYAYCIDSGSADWLKNTIICFSSAHFISAVSEMLDGVECSRALRELILFTFKRLQDCTSLKCAHKLFRHMCVVMLNPLLAEQQVQESLKVLSRQLYVVDDHLNKCRNAEKHKKPFLMTDKNKPLNKMSKFYKHFYFIIMKTRQVIKPTSKGLSNPFFSPTLLHLLLDNFMGIFPFWSGIFNFHKTGTPRYTSTPAENWFQIVNDGNYGYGPRMLADFIIAMYEDHRVRFATEKYLWEQHSSD